MNALELAADLDDETCRRVLSSAATSYSEVKMDGTGLGDTLRREATAAIVEAGSAPPEIATVQKRGERANGAGNQITKDDAYKIFCFASSKLRNQNKDPSNRLSERFPETKRTLCDSFHEILLAYLGTEAQIERLPRETVRNWAAVGEKMGGLPRPIEESGEKLLGDWSD